MVYKNVVKYCNDKEISVSAFEKMCGIGNGTVRLWENDNSKPTLSTLEKMQKSTGISISDWLKEGAE